jgi:ActR/RegA family two-component response regulator
VAGFAAEGGNVVRTARALGLHRNQLRRFLARHPELARHDSGDGRD